MKKILSYLLFWFGLLLYSQNEGAYLYFNNFGGVFIDGCTQEEVPLYDGQAWANTNNVLVGVSNSTISDRNGNLLFYSNGLSVFDRNHNPLPNANEELGNALEGKGNSLILPQPCSPSPTTCRTVQKAAPITTRAHHTQAGPGSQRRSLPKRGAM